MNSTKQMAVVAVLGLVAAGVGQGRGNAVQHPELVDLLRRVGPAAKDAIPALERLTAHDDPQIAERAKVALKQRRGDGR